MRISLLGSTMAPAIGSVSMGMLSGSPHLPQHVAEAHLTQHLIEPHHTWHPAELCGGETDPTSPLAAATHTPLRHTTAAHSAAFLVALPFARARGLMKRTSTTCLQQLPEVPVGLPADLASPQLCREGHIVPFHDINPWAQATWKSHANGPSVPNCQETPSQ